VVRRIARGRLLGGGPSCVVDGRVWFWCFDVFGSVGLSLEMLMRLKLT
jgi:hypothetical protein